MYYAFASNWVGGLERESSGLFSGARATTTVLDGTGMECM